MEFLRALLESQPLVALALTIGCGYLLGQVSIRGFALGVGAVLFTGLAIGAFAPKAAMPSVVGTIGLAVPVLAGCHWRRALDTSLASPHEITRPEHQTAVDGEHYVVRSRSVVVLEAG